jgi:hypothetical protein
MVTTNTVQLTATVTIDPNDLRPLVEQIVRENLSTTDQRLQFTHAEAADMLGLTEQSLHGERRRGRISARRGMRKRFFYRPADLDAYVSKDVGK